MGPAPLLLVRVSRPRRWIPPNSLWEITARTVQSKFLLRPSPEVNDLVLGVIGRALTIFEVSLHDFIWLSNHWHLLATFPNGEAMRGFMNHVQSNVAREIGREEVHNFRDAFWSRRYRALPVLDEGAQAARLRYVLSNGVKEFLVPTPEAWPGVSSLPAHLHGKELSGSWINRTALFHARRKDGVAASPVSKFTTRYAVPVRPLPILQHLSAKELAAHYRQLCREIAEEGAARAKQERRSFRGVAAILSVDPHDSPEEEDRSPSPLCHAATPAIRGAYRRRYTAFLECYLAFSKRFRSGELTALEGMPAWCFPPPVAFRHEGDTHELDNLPAPDPPPA